jgi:hypothetical protein
MPQEGISATRNPDFQKQLLLGSERTTHVNYRNTIELEILK